MNFLIFCCASLPHLLCSTDLLLFLFFIFIYYFMFPARFARTYSTPQTFLFLFYFLLIFHV
jgi:hypothetical protein